MKYSLKTKTFFSLLIILGVFVFNNLVLIKNVNAGPITGTTANSSDQFPHNGTTTISGTISMSAGTVSSQKINGIDGGGLTISSGSTLQLNAYSTFVINPGSKIINNGGILNNIIPGGAKIVKGYLWAKDADNDDCLDPATVRYNDSATVAPVAGYERVRDLLYIEPSSVDDNNPGDGPSCVTNTLTIGDFTATPSSGAAPLNGVDLAVSNIGGTATGNIIYKFDCTSDGIYDFTTDAISATSYTKVDLCNYSSAGTHTAKVEVSRGGLTATKTTTITVNAVSFDFSLGVNPASVNVIKPTSSTTTATTITTTLVSGAPQNVSFGLSFLPTGISANSLNDCSTFPCSRTLTFTISSTAALSSNTITITGTTSGGLQRSKTFTLNICQCTSGVCCDGCSYRTNTYKCDTITQYRCSSTSCGGDVQSRSAPKYCLGTSSTCSGLIGSYSSWITEMDCPVDMKCDSSDYSCTSEGCACTCTSWVNSFCNWTQGCMNQTRTCTPSGCDITSQCNPTLSCTCSNECTALSRMCINDSYTICGNYDSDPCREWRPTTTSCGGCGAANTGGCTGGKHPLWGCRGAGECYVMGCFSGC